MSDNREPENNGNPWVKSLLVWGGIFLALLLVVTMFGSPSDAGGSQLRYSDFREKVTEGSVDEVQIAPDQITGKLKNGQAFTTIPVANDTQLPELLEQNGVRYAGKAPEAPNMLAARIDAEQEARAARSVEVPEQGPAARDHRRAPRQVGGDGRFADAAFHAVDRDNGHSLPSLKQLRGGLLRFDCRRAIAPHPWSQ